MEKKKAIVLGGGISGLSLLWELEKNFPGENLLLEKGEEVGGVIHSGCKQGFLFERGPRIFKTATSAAFLELIMEIGLEDKVITSSDDANHKYLFWNKKLHHFPQSLWEFLFSPLTRRMILSLIREWRVPCRREDESVYSFISRRLGTTFAKRVFEPMAIGIFGGDAHTLSIDACFPELKKWEREYGSLTRGFFLYRKEKKKNSLFMPNLQSNTLFSFANGAGIVPRTLAEKMSDSILFEQEVKELEIYRKEVIVHTNKESFKASTVFSALPLSSLIKLLPSSSRVTSLLQTIPILPMTAAHIGFNSGLFELPGFGYLVPSIEKEPILGTVFDSNIFTEQNLFKGQTRLTMMFRGSGKSESAYREISRDVLKKHLGIADVPDYFSYDWFEGIPQYQVGHRDTIREIEEILADEYPSLYLAGNYLTGVGVNHCIERSKEVVDQWLLAQ